MYRHVYSKSDEIRTKDLTLTVGPYTAGYTTLQLRTQVSRLLERIEIGQI